jgi:hypothetical protein
VFPWVWWWYKQMQEQQGGASPSPGPSRPQWPDGLFRWFHRERDLVSVTIDALATAKRGTWRQLGKKALVRQFRALMLATLRAATLSPDEPVHLGELGAFLYSTPERNAAASALARTFVLLGPPFQLRARRDVLSEEEQPATASFEAALGAVAVVVLASVVAISAAFLGTVIAQGVAGFNFDDEVTQRLLSAHARALEVIAQHVERERIAGRELPFDEVEISLLRTLEDQQRRLATLQRRPLPTPFEGATEFAKTASLSFLPLAAVAVVAFLLLNEKGR